MNRTKTVSSRRRWLIWQRVRHPVLVMETRWPIRLCYSRPGGGICLREETGWRFWSGFCTRFGHHILWFYFRRAPR